MKRILTSLGITPRPSCSCNAMARKMDANGPEWCEEHIAEITAVMVKEANKQGWLRFLPFKQLGAEALVKLAIANTIRLQG